MLAQEINVATNKNQERHYYYMKEFFATRKQKEIDRREDETMKEIFTVVI